MYSRTATSPSWHEEDRFISPAHNNNNNLATSQIQKPNYLESDTRSLSIDGAADHGKFGYTTSTIAPTITNNNNNQFAQSSLGGQHRNNNEPTTQSIDSNNKNSIVDDKQSEYEHDANTETETKSVSSQKSDASTTARYLHDFSFLSKFLSLLNQKIYILINQSQIEKSVLCFTCFFDNNCRSFVILLSHYTHTQFPAPLHMFFIYLFLKCFCSLMLALVL